jgi:hypothetical protein
MMSYPIPPGYQRRSPTQRPKLDAFIPTIDRWLDEDMKVPRKLEHRFYIDVIKLQPDRCAAIRSVDD